MASPGPARLTRIRSDYVGGGSYAVLPDDSALAVNTTYGVQAVAIDGKVKWQVDLGERCLGLSRSTDGVLLANTLHSIHQIDIKPIGIVVIPTLITIIERGSPLNIL